MNSPASWGQALTLLALETGLVVLLAEVIQRQVINAVWRRTIWQIAIGTVACLTLAELAGARDTLARLRGPIRPAVTRSAVSSVKDADTTGPQLTRALREQVAKRLAENQSRVQPAANAPLEAQVPLPLATQPAPLPARNWVALGWSLGILLVLARVLCSRLALSWFRLRSRSVTDTELVKRVAGLARQLRLRRPVRLIESARLTSPVAFGSFVPTIGLPGGFARDFEPVQQEAMLAHELGHLAAGDGWWNLLADGVLALLWWHPLAWHARRQLRAAAETAADEASLLVAGGPGALAECLVQMGTRLAQPAVMGGLGVGGSGFKSELGRRVERLVSLPENGWNPPALGWQRLVKWLAPTLGAASLLLAVTWLAPRAFGQGANAQALGRLWQNEWQTLTFSQATSPAKIASEAQLGEAAAASQPAIAPVAGMPEPALPAPAAPTDVEKLVADGKLLQSLGKLNEAEAKFKRALKIDPGNEAAGQRLAEVRQTRSATPATTTITGLDPELAKRYGITTAPAPVSTTLPAGRGKTAPAGVASRPAKTTSAGLAANPAQMDPALARRYGIAPPVAPTPSAAPAELAADTDEDARPEPPPSAVNKTPAIPQPIPVLSDIPVAGRLFRPTANPALPPQPAVVESLDPFPATPPTGVVNGAPGAVPATSARRVKPAPTPAVTDPAPANRPPATSSVENVERVLDGLFVGSINMVNAPLSEVVTFLKQASIQFDPEHKGVNFFSQLATGAPLRPGAVPFVDVTVSITPALHNVRLRQVLDAIVETGGQPLKYTVTRRGVVFEPAQRQPYSLATRTYKLNAGKMAETMKAMQAAFEPDAYESLTTNPADARKLRELQLRVDDLSQPGVPSNETRQEAVAARDAFLEAVARGQGFENYQALNQARGDKVQASLRNIFVQLGLRMEQPGFALFYNDRTGQLFARADIPALDAIEAALIALLGEDEVKLVAPVRSTVNVLGEVSHPGLYDLPAEPATVIQAIGLAGGFTKQAAKGKVRLIRGTDSQIINVDQMLEGKSKANQNLTLQKGDLIYVPENAQLF